MKNIIFLLLAVLLFKSCKTDKIKGRSEEEALLIGNWNGGSPLQTLTIREDKTYAIVHTYSKDGYKGSWTYDTSTKILALSGFPAFKLLYVTKVGLAFLEVGQTRQQVFERK